MCIRDRIKGVITDSLTNEPLMYITVQYEGKGVGLSLIHIYLIHLHNTFFIFDSIGLALFTVVGVGKSIALGYPFWVAIIMGSITGAAGGVIPVSYTHLYTHTESKEVSGLPGSDPISTWQGLNTIDGSNYVDAQRSQYVVPDKVIASVGYYIPDVYKRQIGKRSCGRQGP